MARFTPPGYQSTRRTLTHTGDGVPDVDTGNANDLYIDRLTGDMYQKNADGTAWEVLGSVAGGGGSEPLSGAGAPDSGAGGLEAPFGAEYYDTSFNPAVLYKQMSEDPATPQWVGVLTGDVTP